MPEPEAGADVAVDVRLPAVVVGREVVETVLVDAPLPKARNAAEIASTTAASATSM